MAFYWAPSGYPVTRPMRDPMAQNTHTYYKYINTLHGWDWVCIGGGTDKVEAKRKHVAGQGLYFAPAMIS